MLTFNRGTILENLLELKSKNVAVPYFFFDARDAQQDLQSHAKFICSLIFQLSHYFERVPSALKNLYDKCNHHQQPYISDLEQTLATILDGFSSVYIVVDALDESNDSQATLDWISGLSSLNIFSKLYFVITSRPTVHVQNVLSHLDIISVDLDAYQNLDLTRYMWTMVLKNLAFEWPCDVIETVFNVLTSKTAGS